MLKENIRKAGHTKRPAFVSIGKPATRKALKKIKTLSVNLTRAAAIISIMLPVTDILSIKYTLPSKTKFLQTLKRFRKNIQTVSFHELSDRHFDIPDTFQECLRYESRKDDHERILILCDPYLTPVLES